MIAGMLAPVHLLLQRDDFPLDRFGGEDRTIMRGESFERHARAVDLPHLGRRETADGSAAKLLQQHQSLGLEALQCLAHAGARAAGLANQVGLDQALTRREPSGADPVA
ncbi:hypothetical protein ABIC16_003935 [Sphingomonas sp. PvP055]